MRITTIYSEESEPSYALTIKLPMERLDYESIYIISIPENSVSIIVDNHALTNREIVLEYVTPQRPIPDMPAWSANPAPGSLDSIDFNTFYVDWENNEIELINPDLITVTENNMIIEGVMVTVAQTSEENGKTTALAITLPLESLNYESSYMISIPEKSVNIIVDGYPLSNEEIILVYVTPANPIPDLPEWTATPEPGILTSIDFNTFNINWGEHNLELLDPGLVSVRANGTEIEGLSISLAPYRTEGNITYENGLLSIELPTETLSYETEYEVTIAANTVNVIIDGIAVGNEEIVLHYTTPEDSGVYSLQADKDGLYKVYSLSGSVIMVTADIHRLSTLNSGMYIINGKKIYIGLR